MSSTSLSKSTYVRGLQCVKSLYIHKKHPELRNPEDQSQQAIFAQGTNVGFLAQQLFPKGKDCSFQDFTEINESLENTQRYIEQGESVIYEAAFKYNNILVFADILVNDRDGWKMYEVKSSTSVKDVYVRDAALQTFVINNCGITLKDVSIVYINNQYVRNGDLEIERLFTIESVRNGVAVHLSEIPQHINRLREYLSMEEIPEKEIGAHCTDPYPCDFSQYCWGNVVAEKSVFDVRGLRANKKFELFHLGIEKLVDIPENYPLSHKQRMQVTGEQTGESFIDKEKIREFVGALNYPLYFLDFETINPAIPLFDFSRPYEQIPFQYSLHIQEEPSGELIHKEYLAETDGTDPRIKFIEQMIADCGQAGDIIVYNKGFEGGKLSALAKVFVKHGDALESLKSRLVDLMVPFQKRWYYTPEMNGSYSIKSVLPALIPELSYSDLEIGDGGTASEAYKTMAAGTFEGDIEQTREDLLKYCELDTLAMVRVLEKLRSI